MSRPQNSIWTLIRPQNQPIRAPIIKKNDPKIKLNSKVEIEVSIENKNYSTTWLDPKTVLELYPDPKNSPLGLRKVKNVHRNSKLHDRAEIEPNSEKKVISLYEETQKQFLNPFPTPKIAH